MTAQRRHAGAWVAAALMVLGSWSTSASASLYRLEAVSSAPSSFSDFSLEFDDTGDGLLQIGEVLSFSGITIEGAFYDSVTQVPDLDGVSALSGTCPGKDPANTWCFTGMFAGQLESRQTDGLTDGSGLWAFTRVPLVQDVPEPTSAALLLLGLAGLASTRRRLGRDASRQR